MHELVLHPLAKLAALVNNSIRKRQKQQIIAITSKIPHHCHYIRIPIKNDRRKCPLVIKIKIKLHITIWSTYQVNYSVGRVLLPCGNVVFIYSQIHTTNMGRMDGSDIGHVMHAHRTILWQLKCVLVFR